jgi:hypothetical protein
VKPGICEFRRPYAGWRGELTELGLPWGHRTSDLQNFGLGGTDHPIGEIADQLLLRLVTVRVQNPWIAPLNSHLAMTAALWRGMAEQLALWIYKRLSGENAALRLAGATANDVKRHARRWHSLRSVGEGSHTLQSFSGGGQRPIPHTCAECGKARKGTANFALLNVRMHGTAADLSMSGCAPSPALGSREPSVASA